MYLGNDIIDLSTAEPPLHKRYMERVLASREQELITCTEEPTSDWIRQLWRFWSVKEAAYKALSRYHNNVTFSPKRYLVESTRSIVCYKDYILPFSIHESDQFIHAVCCMPSSSLTYSSIGLCHENVSPSKQVREAIIRNISELISCDPKHIQMTSRVTSRKRSIPDITIAGEASNIVLSMSHHGRYYAYSFGFTKNVHKLHMNL